ncbi:MAG: hypothetical protein ACI9C4_000394 [Paraglaciecola sp.]|jgi:hypothetical protein
MGNVFKPGIRLALRGTLWLAQHLEIKKAGLTPGFFAVISGYLTR